MNDDDDDKPGKAWRVFWLGLFMISIGVLVSWRLTDDHWKAEMVKRGYAHWVVTSDQGQVEWEWIEK